MQSQISASTFWATFGMCSSETMPLQCSDRCIHKQACHEDVAVFVSAYSYRIIFCQFYFTIYAELNINFTWQNLGMMTFI